MSNAHITETEAAAQLGAQLVEPHVLDTGDPEALALVLPDGNGKAVLVDAQEFARRPRASQPHTVTVFDAESLILYADRYSDPDTGRVVHNPHAFTVTAICDAHGWRAHRCNLRLTVTPEWKAWRDASGATMGQAVFAEFVEDHLHDFVTPDGATMLEIAQTFHAAESARFTSGVRLSTGETRLVYEQSIDAKAGTSGDVVIPSTVALRLTPFEGMTPIEVTARFRFRLSRGELAMGFVLDRPEDVQRTAFNDMSAAVINEMPLWLHTTGEN